MCLLPSKTSVCCLYCSHIVVRVTTQLRCFHSSFAIPVPNLSPLVAKALLPPDYPVLQIS